MPPGIRSRGDRAIGWAMRVLVTGAGGLLGSALGRLGLTALDRRALDVTDAAARERTLDRHRPDAVIFCAALTDVDRCATDPAAYRLNVEAPAAWARRAPLWLVSTNFVFDGPGPHPPDEPPRPCNPYGRQKAEAEAAVRAAGGHVVRTGWLFGPGGRNFPSRLPEALRAGPVRALEGWPVQPTWADDVAGALAALPEGVSHAIGSEETTWAEFAEAAAALMGLTGRVRRVPGVGLGPRPADARLTPATLPGWRARLPLLIGER